MAGFARRVAPAAALGGLAVIIVGVADPAIASWRSADDATAAEVTASEVTTTQDSTSTDTTTTDSGSGTQTRNRGSQSDSESSDTTTSDSTTNDSSGSSEATAAACSSGSTVTGDSVMTRWGPVQVAATVDNGTICEVHAIAWPDNDRKSSQINAYAIPYLDDAATASQGTQIDYVSGATYTSDAYAQSLQSILDQL